MLAAVFQLQQETAGVRAAHVLHAQARIHLGNGGLALHPAGFRERAKVFPETLEIGGVAAPLGHYPGGFAALDGSDYLVAGGRHPQGLKIV